MFTVAKKDRQRERDSREVVGGVILQYAGRQTGPYIPVTHGGDGHK